MTEHAIQPLIHDDGVVRFKANPIVRFLLDAGPFDLNVLSSLPGLNQDDYQHFMQLIGYSLSGYSELRCCDDEVYDDAAAHAYSKGWWNADA